MKIERWRGVLFVVALLAIGINLWIFRPMDQRNSPPLKSGGRPKVIPPEGWCHNQRFKTAKLNPEGLVKQLQDLFKEMQLFQSRHGTRPRSALELHRDIRANMSVYGFRDVKSVFTRNYQPDMQYADYHFADPPGTVAEPFVWVVRRPDGGEIGGPHRTGERDTLAYSDIYYYGDACLFPNGKMTKHPTGFYLVLWEDGEVTRVPFDQIRFAYPQRENAPSECFPGQAGVPSVTYTEAELWKRIKTLRPDGTNPNVVP